MGRWTCSKCKFTFNYSNTCDQCGADPPSSQQKEASPPIKRPDKEAPQITKKQRQKQPRKQRSRKIRVKRGSTHVKPKDKQQKKPEKQVQKQPSQLPPKVNRSKPSMPKDEPEVTQSQKEEETGEKENTHNIWTFSNVILFTGSASYYDEVDIPLFATGIVSRNKYKSPNYPLYDWNYQDFMTLIKSKLPKTLLSKGSNWKFILNTKKKPFKEGTRSFTLYKSYPNSAKDCGQFDCASSYWGYGGDYILLNNKKVGNTSSYMLREHLRNWVKGIEVGFPVFSVSDCNTFHTSGYVWSYYAIKKAPKSLKPLKLAIINFDQHWDSGGSGDVIGSDHWGNGVLRELDSKSRGLYVVVGNDNDGKVGLFNAWNKEKADVLGSLSKHNVNWDHFWNNGGKDINAVFVTVDRDCLKNHYTQWQDSSYFDDWEHLRSVMQEVLEPLFDKKRKTKAYLIGVDITGLPEHYEIWKNRYKDRDKPHDSLSLWATVDSQIDGLHAEVADQLKVTASL